MSSLPPPTMRRAGPTAPTKPKTMANRVADVKGRMTSGPPTGPVIAKPVSRPPTGPVIAKPVSRPPTGPVPVSRPPTPVIAKPVSRPPTGPMGGGMKHGGEVKKMASGGKVSSRADGIAKRGKTKGRCI